MSDIKWLAVDNGTAQVKAAWYEGDQLRTEYRLALVNRKHELTATGERSPGAYFLNGLKYQVTDSNGGTERTDYPEYQYSDQNVVLVHDMARQIFPGERIGLLVSLPILDYYTDDGVNETLVAIVKEKMTQAVLPWDEKPMAEIVDVKVVPEGIPHFMDVVTDELGQSTDMAEGRVVIFDLGGHSVDIATCVNGDVVSRDMARFGTLESRTQFGRAVSLLLKGTDVPASMLEAAMQTGRIGRRIDVEEQRESALAGYRGKVMNLIDASAEAKLADLVILVGGGAHFMRDHVDQDIHIPMNPHLAGARGMAKMMRGAA